MHTNSVSSLSLHIVAYIAYLRAKATFQSWPVEEIFVVCAFFFLLYYLYFLLWKLTGLFLFFYFFLIDL